MLKTFITLLALGVINSCCAQYPEFKGYMAYDDGSRMGYGYLIYPLIKDTVTIDSTGEIYVDLKMVKHRMFYVSNGNFNSRIYNFQSGQAKDSLYNIIIPDTAYYTIYHKKKLCPICLQSNTLLSIRYGLPSPAMIKAAEKRKIILGGCIISDNRPLLYCRKDDFAF